MDTRSDPFSASSPSSPGQWLLLHDLYDELRGLGLHATLTDKGYIYATLPSNTDKQTDVIGFIAHVDTSPEFSAQNVKPQIFRDYDGKVIELGCGRILSPEEFPDLKKLVGQTIITTSGNSLLGGDDKAGVAIIMSAIKFLLDHPELKHGEIKVSFTPDEEISRGTKFFDIEKFGADYAITVDGLGTGEYNYENFIASSAYIEVKGFNIHTAIAKGKMVNAIKLAAEIEAKIPQKERPEYTEGREGFYHLVRMEGEVQHATMEYNLRDFDAKEMEKRIETIQNAVLELNEKYGGEYATVMIEKKYTNMKDAILKKAPFLVDMIHKAIEHVGLQAYDEAIRGGTDGARLSAMGLPCPNIFAGVYNCHGPYEFVCLDSMEKAKHAVIEIIKMVAER